MEATNTTICVFNAGAIRIDDQLIGTITQYDILRCLPFAASLVTIRVNGSVLLKVLSRGLSNINTGMFISYAGIQHDTVADQWFTNDKQQLIEDNDTQYTIVSIPYFYHNTALFNSSTILGTHTTLTKAFITYLERVYKKTRRHTIS